MTFSSWNNKYIELVGTIPELLVACDNKLISAQEVDFIQSRISNYKKIYLELGSGSGQHLIERAARDPESLYIGIELRYKRAFRTAEKAQEREVRNLLVLRTNANTLPQIFAKESLTGIYINFPDPWSRQRWKKHRMINEQTIPLFQSLLKKDGFFQFKTDHKDYYTDTFKLLETLKILPITKHTLDLHSSEFNSENVVTEFESLFISKGLPTYFLEARK